MGYGGCVRPIKFFRSHICSITGPEISDYLEELKKDSIKINEEVIKLMFYMPNLSWDDAWDLTHSERNQIVSTINEIRSESK